MFFFNINLCIRFKKKIVNIICALKKKWTYHNLWTIIISVSMKINVFFLNVNNLLFSLHLYNRISITIVLNKRKLGILLLMLNRMQRHLRSTRRAYSTTRIGKLFTVPRHNCIYLPFDAYRCLFKEYCYWMSVFFLHFTLTVTRNEYSSSIGFYNDRSIDEEYLWSPLDNYYITSLCVKRLTFEIYILKDFTAKVSMSMTSYYILCTAINNKWDSVCNIALNT